MFVNASDRPALHTITDRGVAMMPLLELWRGVGSATKAHANAGGANHGLGRGIKV